ncbi:MAG: SprT-like domain-containing protein [Methylococcales bacterium]|nr:SprT-like domain-containing protein [Methylococcales bacterium]
MKPTTETYAELTWAYDVFNQSLFDGKLPNCLITLQREKHTCGYFSSGRFANIDGALTDEIAINPSYFAVTPIIEIMQTLVHEMVHLWQFHLGTPGRGRYHNKEWADKMESIGLMPSSTGRPGGKKTGDRIADYAIENGLFLMTCKNLLTQSFKLSWYDRYPDARVANSGQSSIACQLENMPESATSIRANQPNSLVQIQSAPIKDTQINTTNKATRMKYTCDCRINIWAKPGIHVKCCECNTTFAESNNSE